MSKYRSMMLLAGAVVIAVAAILSGCPKPQETAPTTPPMGMMKGAPPAPTGAKETIRQIGSTTVLPAAQKWQPEFNKTHPNVDIAVSGGGSGTGIKALISKTAEIADASRKIEDKEVADAKAAGVNPVEHVVAFDGIAVIVNPDNPVKKLTMQQVSDIYTGKIKKWDEVGGKGDIQLVNRDTSSGTYGSFKEMVVQFKDKKADYAPGTLNQASNEAVRTLVAKTKNAIGYVGLAYIDSTIKGVPIDVNGKLISASVETVQDATYPISRKLYCYTNGEATGALKEYLDWIVGPEGQAIVKEVGYVPLSK